VKRLGLCALALCGGCYPWIGGGWDAWWEPEEVQIVGSATIWEPQGGYWGDPSPYGATWWGWLPEPDDTLLALDLVAASGQGCLPGRPDERAVTDRLADPGGSLSELTGPTHIQLAWLADRVRFHAITDQLPTATWDLEPIETEEGGTLQAEGFLAMPGAPRFTGPVLDGAGLATAGVQDLAFSWEPSETEADWAVIEVWLARSSPTGYQSYEWATCVVPWEDGAVAFAEALWSAPAQADAAYIFEGAARETFVRAGRRDFSATALGLRYQVGVVLLTP